MMKKLISLLLLTQFSYAQYTFTKEGLTPTEIITESDSASAKNLYAKSIDWIKESFEDPDEVIKARIDGKKIRFKGVTKNAYHTQVGLHTATYDLRYAIELSFKEGRYRFKVLKVEQFTNGAVQVGWMDFDMTDGSWLYKKNGKIKKRFLYVAKGLEDTFNSIYKSHNNYINGLSSEDDW